MFGVGHTYSLLLLLNYYILLNVWFMLCCVISALQETFQIKIILNNIQIDLMHSSITPAIIRLDRFKYLKYC